MRARHPPQDELRWRCLAAGTQYVSVLLEDFVSCLTASLLGLRWPDFGLVPEFLVAPSLRKYSRIYFFLSIYLSWVLVEACKLLIAACGI